MGDDTRNAYSEALSALDELRRIPQPVGPEASQGRAQVKASEAAALASIAAADAMYAVRNELEGLGARLQDK